MTNSNAKPLTLIAAALVMGASLSAQTMIERRGYVGQSFGVNSINVPGSRYDISRDAAMLRMSMYSFGSTPAAGNYGDTYTYANGGVRAGLFGRQRELVYGYGYARSQRRLIFENGYFRNGFAPSTNVYLRVNGTTYQHPTYLRKSPSSPITYFSQTWFFMAGPVPITIYGNVRGSYSLMMNASVGSWNRRCAVSASHMARAWGNSSGQVGIPGAGIGLESDIELASPIYASVSTSTLPGTTTLRGQALSNGSIGGTFRMTMYPIAIKLKAYVEFLWNRYSYTLLNWRLDNPISRTWSL